jgi:hypothetical protein
MNTGDFINYMWQYFNGAVLRCTGNLPQGEAKDKIEKVIREYTSKFNLLTEKKGQKVALRGMLKNDLYTFHDTEIYNEDAVVVLKKNKKQFTLPLLDVLDGKEQVQFQ